ncbi:MAG: methenyltetrahydromethanopterin cyclohydrolase [Spirochaetota bacterium]
MLSVNKRAMKVVRKIIEDHEALDVGIMRLSNGSTVIDMGVQYPGGWSAAKYLVEATLGGLGTCTYGTFILDEFELPQVEIHVDKPVIACLSCQLSGWALAQLKGNSGIVPLISGPIRTIIKEDDFARELPYQDHSDEVVAALQSETLPDEKLTSYLAEKAGLTPDKVYLLTAATGSLTGMVNIAARTLETALWQLHKMRFPIDRIISAWGKAPIPPLSKDEYTAMIRANTYVYYGGTAGFIVECRDEEIEKILLEVILSPETTKQYGISFGQLLKEAGGNIFNMKDFTHSVTKVMFYNRLTGRSFVQGKNDRTMLLSCI